MSGAERISVARVTAAAVCAMNIQRAINFANIMLRADISRVPRVKI